MAGIWKKIAPGATASVKRCAEILGFMDPRNQDLSRPLILLTQSAMDQWLADASGLAHSLFAYYADSAATTDSDILLVLAITSKANSAAGVTKHDKVFVEMLGFALDKNRAPTRKRKMGVWFDLFRQVLVDLSTVGINDASGLIGTATQTDTVEVRALRSPTMSAMLKPDLDAHVRSHPMIEVNRESEIRGAAFWKLTLTRG